MEAQLPRFSPDSRKDLILSAARASFLANGFSGTTTRDVAALAGVSEGLIFRHFGSKRNLFELAVLAPLRQAVEGAVRDVEATPGGPSVQTGEFHAVMLQTFSEIAPLLALALFSEQESGRVFFDENVRPLFDAFAAALDRVVETGSAPPISGRMLTSVLYGAYFAYGSTRYFGDESITPAEAAKQLADFVARGLGLEAWGG